MNVVIANNDAGQRDHLRQIVLSLGMTCEPRDVVSLDNLAMRLGQQEPDLVLVILGRHGAAAVPFVEQAVGQVKKPVLAVGASDDSHAIRAAVRAGAKEYLDEHNLRDELVAALTRLGHGGTADFRRGTTIAVCAAMPGAGVTTVATNLAFALGEKYPNKVALAEMGGGVPELALALDLQPRHDVEELAQHWDRLDSTMMAQTLVQHQAGVQVLAHKPETLSVMPLAVEPMQHSLLLLKGMFSFVVLDLGHYVDPPTVQALTLADKIIVVVRLDVPCLRLTRRFVQQFVLHGIDAAKVQVVANRYGQRKQIAWKQAEQTLGLPILEGIPDDSSSLNDAVNQGQPLVKTARRAGITKTFDKLATRMNGRA